MEHKRILNLLPLHGLIRCFQDFMIKLPGINSKNVRRVLNKVKDLEELLSFSQVSGVHFVC